jgi:hypothetical protein
MYLSLFAACDSPGKKVVAQQQFTPPAGEATAPDSVQQTRLSPDYVVKAYSSATAEYLKAAFKKKQRPDTLFLGKHEDFPHESFPTTILKSTIMLIEPEDAYKWHDRNHYVSLNVIGNLNMDDAEFTVIRFDRYSRPQHNCLINLKYYDETRKFELISLDFEYPYTESYRIEHRTNRR